MEVVSFKPKAGTNALSNRSDAVSHDLRSGGTTVLLHSVRSYELLIDAFDFISIICAIARMSTRTIRVLVPPDFIICSKLHTKLSPVSSICCGWLLFSLSSWLQIPFGKRMSFESSQQQATPQSYFHEFKSGIQGCITNDSLWSSTSNAIHLYPHSTACTV